MVAINWWRRKFGLDFPAVYGGIIGGGGVEGSTPDLSVEAPASGVFIGDHHSDVILKPEACCPEMELQVVQGLTSPHFSVGGVEMVCCSCGTFSRLWVGARHNWVAVVYSQQD